MAVTQQLARVSPSRIERCRREESELNRLISFELGPGEASIDLDWSAMKLVKGFEYLGEAVTLRLLKEVLGEGANVVNSEHPTGPTDYRVHSAITAVDETAVAALSEKLKSLSLKQRDMVLSHAVKVSVEEGALSRASAQDHYREVFWRLYEFVQAASRLKQTIATWWD